MADQYVAYVGSYTRGDSKGLHIFDFNAETLEFKLRDVFEINNPSFVHLSHDGQFLYCNCDEGIAAFRIMKDGSLVLINKGSVNGLRPCYISTDRANRYLITAGYHDGKLTVLRLMEDGGVGPVTDEVFMKGLGSVAGRNYRCHVNCALFTPDEHYVLAVDLGMDQVKIYEFDHECGKIILHDILRCELESGPKHMIFSKDGQYAYLTHEDRNYVTQYAYDAAHARFEKRQALSTVPEKFEGYNSAITLKLSSDETHLFVTNSGDNSVAVYKIDPETKAMTMICILPTSGDYPRDLIVVPGRDSFVCVNQESNSLTCFDVNYDGHYIAMNGAPVKVSCPTSMKIKKLD